jgi:peptidoglycan/xylan/chitin deacetylase (PgdA/CDA1 family)
VSPRLAITIDAEHPDRPADPANPGRLFELLERLEVPATVFMQGRWATANPTLAERVAKAGHLIGNHSMSHTPLPTMTESGMRRSVLDAAEAIERVTRVDPKPWFRLPYGEGDEDPRVLAVLSKLGYRRVGWEVDTRDWEPDRDVASLAETAISDSLGRGDGARLLFHSWPDATLPALEAIVPRLRSLGAELVRIDEL